MSRSLRLLPLVAISSLGLLAGGCDVFDESLYMMADGGGAAGFALSDTCVGDLPVRESSAALIMMDTRGLGDHISALAACTGHNAPGSDGFFAVSMEEGDKWHFHIRSLQAGRNPVVYVLGSACDARTCQAGHAIDSCGEGSDEHLSFVAPRAGTYSVAVDDRNEGGALYEVLAVRPECYNGGMPEHSETCDDGNTDDGDGCDASCRAELSATRTAEVEPNDDPTGANVVQIGASETLTVTGSIGGRCDFDLYALDVPGGASVHATMRNRSGEACPADTPPIDMVLIGPNGTTILGDGAARDGSACPVIDEGHAFAGPLPAGMHYVRVHMGEEERPFDYRLTLSLATE